MFVSHKPCRLNWKPWYGEAVKGRSFRRLLHDISHGDILQHRNPFSIVGLEMNVCNFK